MRYHLWFACVSRRMPQRVSDNTPALYRAHPAGPTGSVQAAAPECIPASASLRPCTDRTLSVRKLRTQYFSPSSHWWYCITSVFPLSSRIFRKITEITCGSPVSIGGIQMPPPFGSRRRRAAAFLRPAPVPSESCVPDAIVRPGSDRRCKKASRTPSSERAHSRRPLPSVRQAWW